MSDLVLETSNLSKTYLQGEQEIVVLSGVDFTMRAGERVAITGRSGSGKSTLLHVLAGLDEADAGEVLVGGVSMTAADANERARLRAQQMGFVYQHHHLLAEFSALENVSVALRLAGHDRNTANERAGALLDQVGLAHRASHVPGQLSGGERQRVAIARAIAGEPRVVLADEPTGNLDQKTADQVFELMISLSEQFRTAFLVVTHDTSVLNAFHRTLGLVAGQLEDI